MKYFLISRIIQVIIFIECRSAGSIFTWQSIFSGKWRGVRSCEDMCWTKVLEAWWRLLSLVAGPGLGVCNEPVCNAIIFLCMCKAVWPLGMNLSVFPLGGGAI